MMASADLQFSTRGRKAGGFKSAPRRAAPQRRIPLRRNDLCLSKLLYSRVHNPCPTFLYTPSFT